MVKRLLPVYFVVFLGYIGYSLFLTIFAPLFLKGDIIQASDEIRVVILGILVFLYPFGQFISSPVLGALSDRFGRRPLLLYSLCVTCVAYVVIGLSLVWGMLWLTMLALFIAGLSEGNITIAQSAVADVSDGHSRHRLFGYIYFSASCAYVVGPMLGGWLAGSHVWNGMSYELPFFIVAVMLIVAFFWVWGGFKETVKQKCHVSYLEGFTNFRNLFVMKKFRFWFLVNFLLYLTVFGFLQGFPIFLVALFGVEVGPLSLMIAWTDIPFLLVNLLLIDYLTKRFKPVNLVMYMAGMLASVMMVMLLPREVYWMWPILLMGGFAAAVALPVSASLISLMASEKEQGRVMGVNQSLNFLTEALAGLGFGLLASALVKLSVFVFGFMGFIVVLLLVGRRVFGKAT